MSWTQAAAYSNRFEANLVIAKLTSAGIPAYLSADDLAGNFPLMQLAEGGCRVVVPSHHKAAALREITSVGRYAIDTFGLGARQQTSEIDRARQIGYVIGAIVGWGLGYAPWWKLFWFSAR